MSGREGIKGNERSVLTVSSVVELSRAMDRTYCEAAVYEAPRFEHSKLVEKHALALARALQPSLSNLFDMHTTNPRTFKSAAEVARHNLNDGDISAQEIKLLEPVIDAILSDLEQTLAPFAKHYISYLSVRVAGRDVSSNTVWHRDLDAGNVNIVRTFCGHSTEYASDLAGNNKQIFKDGAITVHKGNIPHRGPTVRAGVSRFAIVLRLNRAFV